MLNNDDALYIVRHPIVLAHALGYDKLTARLHDDWIKRFAFSDHDLTHQAHRNSYKTSSVIVAITLRMVVLPNEPMIILRKNGGSTAEVLRAVSRNLESEICNELSEVINGVGIDILQSSNSEMETNLKTRGGVKEKQLVGDGVRSFGLTGKHFPRIYTDDIITVMDRISRAERMYTDMIYQELQNIKTPGGVIVNTGTPWHRNDTFNLMPNAVRYDCYQTGILSNEEIMEKKSRMTASLFSANYELRHISDEDSFFKDPKYAEYPVVNGRKRDSIAHIDCAYGGTNTTALTIMTFTNDKIYAHGAVFEGHVQEHYKDIAELLRDYSVGTLYSETNADKGYFAKEFKAYHKAIRSYSESMNKHLKITTYLVRDWERILWTYDTSTDYMEQVVDYQEGQEPDDAPDSASSLLRASEKPGRVSAGHSPAYKR